MFQVSVEESFSSGHALRGYKGKCENVHGHNYRVQVTLEGPQLDAIGLLVDLLFGVIVLHHLLVMDPLRGILHDRKCPLCAQIFLIAHRGNFGELAHKFLVGICST